MTEITWVAWVPANPGSTGRMTFAHAVLDKERTHCRSTIPDPETHPVFVDVDEIPKCEPCLIRSQLKYEPSTIKQMKLATREEIKLATIQFKENGGLVKKLPNSRDQRIDYAFISDNNNPTHGWGE